MLKLGASTDSTTRLGPGGHWRRQVDRHMTKMPSLIELQRRAKQHNCAPFFPGYTAEHMTSVSPH